MSEKELEKLQQKIDEDKNFYREMLVDSFEEMRKSNSAVVKELKEHNKIAAEQSATLIEVKNSLQNKPCIIDQQLNEVNKGWKDKTLSVGKWLIASLIGLLAAAIGLKINGQ